MSSSGANVCCFHTCSLTSSATEN